MTADLGRRLVGTALFLLALLAGTTVPARAQLPPDARWWSFDTPHFRVHYTQGLEVLARRAADRAERAYAELAETLVRPPEGRIDLLLSDNVDFANGYASPFPRNRIVVYAHPPVDEPTLSFYDDWLELVITHELTHVFHLDYAGGIWRPLRSVFGRAPFLFPAVVVPGWATEGLATYAESELTRAGRVRGTMHDMVLRAAVLEDAFFSIDRATGTPATWPGGSTRYVYGSLFVAHLAEKYGPERVGEFVRAVGGSLLPYRLNAAAKRAFGVSFPRAWREWEETLRARYLPLADSLRAAGLTEPEELTGAGRYALFPRFSPEGTRISYAASTGREEPSTRVLYLLSGEDRPTLPRTTLGPASWLAGGDTLLLAQMDFVDPYRVYADLYRGGSRGDDLVRVTRRARVTEPHPSPDGRRAVVIDAAGGSNVPAVVDLATRRVRRLAEPSLDVHWSLPRWSPDGARIAVSRWRAGGYYDVVVLDTAGRVLHELTRDRAVDAAPAWSPDGRYVLFSSDRTGITNLYAHDLAEGRLFQVTSVLTGAFLPDVSPDGRWIVFSHYRADGYHVARIPFDTAQWRPAPPVRPQVAAVDGADYAATAGGPARRYSPWRSLAPAAWIPAVDWGTDLGAGAGAAVVGEDLVGRHTYGAYALLHPEGTRLDAGAAWLYRGLGRPLVSLSGAQEWSVLIPDSTRVGTGAEARTIPTGVLERERSVGVGLTFPRPRFRSYTWLSVGGEWSDRDFSWDVPEAAGSLRDRAPLALPPEVGMLLTVGRSTVREYEFSISQEDGVLLAATLEAHRYVRGVGEGEDPTGYRRATGRARGYHAFPLWGFARHVLAARFAAGVEDGARAPGFRVGGAGGGPSPLPDLLDPGLGGSLAFPLRGYEAGTQRGDRAMSASVEYRFPLRLVERGVGVLPVFLDRLWGDLFADAGAAWCPGVCARPLPRSPSSLTPLYSAGAELGADLTAGYFAGVRLRGGVAVPLRDAPGVAERFDPELYLRFGRSF